MKSIPAIFEDGVFKPQVSVELSSGARVELIVSEPSDDPVTTLRARFPKSFGGMSRAEGQAMMKDIDEEFERIDPDAWR